MKETQQATDTMSHTHIFVLIIIMKRKKNLLLFLCFFQIYTIKNFIAYMAVGKYIERAREQHIV